MRLFILIIALATISACKVRENDTGKTTTELENKKLNLAGTWEMIGYYNYVDDQIVDSFRTNDQFRQVKMFTNEKVMWSKNVPSDSSEWFGYGGYNLDPDANELIEVLEYGSEMMKKIIEEKKEFKYEIHLDRDKFSQIEVDDNGNRVYSENYKRIE